MFETNMQSHKLLLAALLVVCFANSIRAEDSLFERDVLPVLTKQCLGCHGGLRQKGGLDMRTIPLIQKGGKSGPAVKVGDANASEMWKRIAADEMPPGDKKLSAAEKNSIKQWIANGLSTVAERQKSDDPLLSKDKHAPKEVAAAIDRHVQNGLTRLKLKEAPRSDDAEFLRRIYLDLTGRVPTAEQAVAFLDSQDPEKRAALIDQLLGTPQFGEQLGRTWREWICPPELPSDANAGTQPHKEVQALGKWMGERFTAGDSWDKITRDLLTVQGETKNNPQAIFFGLNGEGGRLTPDGTARAVASLFMGVQLQCAQCHDDPYRDWSQKDHWALAAFFGRTSGDFGNVREGNRGNNPSIAIPKTAFKNVGMNVPAAFLNGKKIEPDGSRFDRERLVNWLAAKDNPYFARAFANRTWFYFFGRGLVNPIDDFRDLNPPTHPGLMNLLTNEFAASGFDVKHLIRCICNSEAYQRTSRVAKGTDEQTVAALTAAFGRMPIRIMTADQLYDSLKQAYGDPNLDLRGIDPKDGNTKGESAPVLDPYLEFLRRFGTNKEDPADFTHGIPQMLTMINHPRLQQGSKALDEFRKANAKATAEQIVEWLYLSTLSRRPTSVEQTESQQFLNRSPEAYHRVLWALANRSEYLLVR
jgi:hypothetical protein